MRRLCFVMYCGMLLAITAPPLSAQPSADAVSPAQRVADIEAAHQGSLYAQRQAVQADFSIDFGGMAMSGTMIFDPAVGKVRMQLEGGAVIVFDGATAWLSPADAAVPGPPARFHVLTWPYFVAAAYKLDDPGTSLSDAGMLPLRAGQQREGIKVTFDAGVGDTPDDWYIAFADPDTGRLSALAYIVTYGKPQEEAEKTPGIILYDDFVEVEGVPFATRWTFHHWDEKQGVHGEPKGTGTLSNIQFAEPVESTFVNPNGAVEAKMPGE